MRLLFFCLFFLALSVCLPGDPTAPIQVVQVNPANPQNYELATVNLQTLTNLNDLSGVHFRLLGQMTVDGQLYGALVEHSHSFDEFQKYMRPAIGGVPVKPNLIWDGSAWLARDFDTLTMTTVFHQFENIWRYSSDVIKDSSGALARPTVIGVYGDLIANAALPIPLLTSDNAAYLPGLDIWYLLRIGDQAGLPFSMNPGVLAHEFHHRLFFYNVWANRGPEGFALWTKQFVEGQQLPAIRSQILLKATDEGLADLFAIGYSGSPNFLKSTLTDKSLGSKRVLAQRDLEGEFANQATYDNLADSSLPLELLRLCRERSMNFTNKKWSFYCFGTVLARTFWDASNRDLVILNHVMLPLINKSLKEIGIALVSGRDYDVDILLDAVAVNASLETKKSLCDQYQRRFSQLYKIGRIPACL